MLTYLEMQDLLEEKEINDFKLEKFNIDKSNFRALLSGIPEGDYISLKHNGTILMSNTPMEKRTNSEFITKANGDVLIAGLGIGLIVLPIQDKENIKSITIIEKQQEIINMVASQLPLNNKVNIICDDIFNYIPNKKYDTIYLDIWPYVNSDIYKEEMLPLKNKYRKYLVSKNKNSNRFIKCWAEQEARYDRCLY